MPKKRAVRSGVGAGTRPALPALIKETYPVSNTTWPPSGETLTLPQLSDYCHHHHVKLVDIDWSTQPPAFVFAKIESTTL